MAGIVKVPVGVHDALLAFGLASEPRSVSPLKHGFLNLSWLARNPSRSLVLKQLIGTPAGHAQQTQGLLARLHEGGMCVPAPLTADSGFLHAAPNGRKFVATAFVDGTHPRSSELTVEQADELGRQLARLHHELWRLPELGVARELAGACDPREPLDCLAINKVARFGRLAEALTRNALVATHTTHRHDVVVAGTHGDMQPYNIILRPGRDQFVFLDFDRVRRQPVHRELFRVVQMILFAPADTVGTLTRVSAFVSAYLDICDAVSSEEIAHAWPNHLAELAADCWQVRSWLNDGTKGQQALDFFFVRQGFIDWASSHMDELVQATACR